MTNPIDFCILQLRIHRFAGIGGVNLSFKENTVNIVYGENRSGKTSVCECIRFLLYGLSSPDNMLPWEGEGKISAEMELRWGNRHCLLSRSHDNGNESLSLIDIDTREEIPLTTSPGELFTGLTDWMYIRTLYFAQKQTDNIQKNLDSASLDRLAAPLCGEKELYSRHERLVQKSNHLMNGDKSGRIDILLEQKHAYEIHRDARRAEQAEIDQLQEKITKLSAAIEEQNPKTVLLKANMKNLSDSIKGLGQTEQFATLHSTLSADELRYQRMLSAAKINGVFPAREEIDALKEEYQNYHAATEQLTTEKDRLLKVKNNLDIHNALVESSEDDIDLLSKKYNRASARSRICIYFSLLFFMLAFICTLFLDDLFFLWFDRADRYYLGFWLGGCALITGFILLTRFFMRRSEMHIYLEDAGADTAGDLKIMRDQKAARRQSILLYAAEVNKQESVTRAAQKKQNDTLQALRTRLSFACNETVPVDTLLYTARTVLESASPIFALEKKIAEEKSRYNSMMEGNAGKDFLSMQSEYARMEEELAAVHASTQKLMEEKNTLSARLEEKLQNNTPDENLIRDMQTKEKELFDLLELYRAVQMEAEAQKQKIESFEEEFKMPLCSYINSFLSFTMRKDESFLLGKSLELLYKRSSTVNPVYTAGGGLSELAIIALRLAYIEQLQGNCAPLLFDEAFAYVDRQSLSHLYAALTGGRRRQILFFSSSQHEKSALPKNANIIRLMRDPS